MAAIARAARIDEIEFELDRKHGGQPVGGEAVDHAAKDVARIEVVRGAVELVEVDEELRGVVAAPRRADERAGDRLHRAVGVAILPDEAGFDGILPGDIDDGDRAGKHAAAFVDRENLVLAQALAARDAAEVGVDHLNRIDVGVGLEKGLGFRTRRDHAR